MNTTIITKDLDISSLYDEFIKEYTVVMVETISKDISLAYIENKEFVSDHEFNRTVFVIDRDADVEAFKQKIYDDIEQVHKISTNKESTLQFFSDFHIVLFAKTGQYWDDVRYFAYDNRSYLASDAFENNILQTKVLELVKDYFYDKDALADICLEQEANTKQIDFACKVINKGIIDLKAMEPLLIRNTYVYNFYEKLLLQESLLEELNKDGNKKNKNHKL